MSGGKLRAYGYTREAMYVTVIVNLVTLLGKCLVVIRLVWFTADVSGWCAFPPLLGAWLGWCYCFGLSVNVGLRLHWMDYCRFRPILSVRSRK